MESLFRYAAFTDRPEGGNPAGVWIGDRLPAPDIMQRIAAEVGFAETACVACGRPHAHVLAGVSGPWEPAPERQEGCHRLSRRCPG